MAESERGTGKLRALAQLSAPHTWPAAVTPTLLGIALSAARGAHRPWIGLLTLATGVLLQSAINTINDWRDFTSGLDTAENCDDPTDAALVYAPIRPRQALAFGLSLMLAAGICGAVLTARCGLGLLWYGAAALAAIVLYTLPHGSFSSLPLGEALSGTVMGVVLPCAAFHAQTGWACGEWFCFLPSFLTVACIMLANNGSDIEKDRSGGRRTLAVLIGRRASAALWKGSLAASAVLSALFVVFFFPKGAAGIIPLAIGLLLPTRAHAPFTLALLPTQRRENMTGTLAAHIWITGAYLACIILSVLAN